MTPPPIGPHRSPLAHPAFWVALALLLLNDHVLKGNPAWPELVTGKLSDLAGLIVAPLVLIALVGAERRATRIACYVAVALPFVAINVSTLAAASFTTLSAWAGVPWNMITDAEDLIALCVLPLAHLILVTAPVVQSALARRATHRIGLSLGALACVASSNDWSAASFVVNRTAEPIDIRVRFADAQLDCEALHGQTERALSRASFGAGTTFTIDTDQTLPLTRGQRAFDRSATVRDDRVVGGGGFNGCEAVLLQADGMPDTVLFWDKLAHVRVPRVLLPDDEVVPKEGMLEIHAEGETLRPVPGSGLAMSTLVDRLDPSSCGVLQVERFQWSSMPSPGVTRIEDIVVGPDGCLVLDFEAAEQPAYLCIPPDELPFAPGDPIVIGSIDGGAGLELLRPKDQAHERASITVLPNRTEFSAQGIDGVVVGAADCEGERTECGSYVAPGAVKLSNGSQVVAATALELRRRGGSSTRLVVGRAERVIVGSLKCEPGRDQAVIQADLLIVSRGE